MRAMKPGVLLLAAALILAPMDHGRAVNARRVVRRAWHDNGRLAEERGFVNGRESGVHRGWWPTGDAHFVYGYRDGLLEGLSREWYPSGALWREQHYSAGHEDGLQRLYWEDGRVRASYVVRDGRRYGLMGAKGCVTKADSAGARLI